MNNFNNYEEIPSSLRIAYQNIKNSDNRKFSTFEGSISSPLNILLHEKDKGLICNYCIILINNDFIDKIPNGSYYDIRTLNNISINSTFPLYYYNENGNKTEISNLTLDNNSFYQIYKITNDEILIFKTNDSSEKIFYNTIGLYLKENELTYDKPKTLGTQISFNTTETEQLLHTFNISTSEKGKILQNSLFLIKLFFENLPLTSSIILRYELIINDTLVLNSRDIILNNTNQDFLLEENSETVLSSILQYSKFNCKLKLFGKSTKDSSFDIIINDLNKPSAIYRIEKSDNLLATTEQYGLVKINNSLNDDIDTTVASSRTIKKINDKIELVKMPLFVPYPSFDLTLKSCQLWCDGNPLAIAGFPSVKEKFDEFTTSGGLPDGTIPADAKGVPWVDFNTYENILASNVNVGCPYWGYDIINGLFRTPTISDGTVLAGGTGSERFKSYRDQIQNITAGFGSAVSRSVYNTSIIPTGAVKFSDTYAAIEIKSGTTSYAVNGIDASLVARTGTETRNKQIRLPYKVNVADVFHIASDAQWEGFVDALSAKANVDMDNLSAMGKANVTNLGAVSTMTIENITFPYTLPADGYVARSRSATTVMTSEMIFNNTSLLYRHDAGQRANFLTPLLKKGTVVTLKVDANGLLEYSRFIYAEGVKP